MKQKNRQLTLLFSFCLLLLVIFTQINLRKNTLAKEIEDAGTKNECLTLKAQGYCTSCKSTSAGYVCVGKDTTPTKTKTSSGSVSSAKACASGSGKCEGKSVGDSCGATKLGKVCTYKNKKTTVCICAEGLSNSNNNSNNSNSNSDSAADNTTNTPVTETPTPTTTTELTSTPTLTPTATITLTPTPTVCATKSVGDANCDSSINGVDFSLWLNSLCSSSCSNLNADFNNDNIINESDYYVWFTNRE